MYKRKSGITVAMVVVMIFIISVLTTTITISVNQTLKSSKLRGFATELALVQNTVNDYLAVTSSVDYTTTDIKITPSTDVITEQFSGETFTSGNVLLHVLDLEKLGMAKTVYGNGKTEKDVYAVSFETGKVYYIQGYDAGNKIYYTLTQDLNNMLSGNEDTGVVTNNVIFVPSSIGWTNQAIRVTVKVPTVIDISTVTVTTSVTDINVSSATLNGSYNDIIVNSNNIANNYTITVNYILNGQSQTQTYSVNNYDNVTPVIATGEQGYEKTIYDSDFYAYIEAVSVTDNSNSIKEIKYEEGSIAEEQALEYFASNGIILANGKDIRITPEVAEYTIYAKDYAGNIAIKVVQIDADIYELVKNWDENWPGIVKTSTGTSAITFSGTGANLIDYKIYGNSVQNGTPSPSMPVEIESVGDKSKNLLSVPDTTVSGTGTWTFKNLGDYELPAGTYTLSAYYKKTGEDKPNAMIAVRQYGAATPSYKEITVGSESGRIVSSFTVPEGSKGCRIYIYSNATSTAYNTECNFYDIQIEEGTTVSDYVPYGKYAIPISVSGKNILNKSSSLSDGIKNETEITGWAVEVFNNSWVVSNLKASTTYTISYDVEGISVPQYDSQFSNNLGFLLYSGVSGYSEERLFLSQYIQEGEKLHFSKTFTTPANIHDTSANYRILVYTNRYLKDGTGLFSAVKFTSIQIEQGSTETRYNPYAEPRLYKIFLDEPLRKIGGAVDYIDFESKKLYRNVQVIDDTGTLSIEQSLSGVNDTEGSNIELPDIETHKGTNYLSVLTEVPPSNISITHYYKGT